MTVTFDFKKCIDCSSCENLVIGDLFVQCEICHERDKEYKDIYANLDNGSFWDEYHQA